MDQTVLIVPGYRGSGAGHWQTWLEQALPEAHRVGGIDWDQPVLARWAVRVRQAIDAATGQVWIVAHSFGCLASVVAAADRADRVAGLLLVAPADPERFHLLGLRDGRKLFASVAGHLPAAPLRCPSMLVASRSDPWLSVAAAQDWAARWGSRFIDVGEAGHINVDSGHGPWPLALNLLAQLRMAETELPAQREGPDDAPRRAGNGVLARVRHHTRRQLNGQAGTLQRGRRHRLDLNHHETGEWKNG